MIDIIIDILSNNIRGLEIIGIQKKSGALRRHVKKDEKN
jgi:hypothetical protein